jgi:hypothetical protein
MAILPTNSSAAGNKTPLQPPLGSEITVCRTSHRHFRRPVLSCPPPSEAPRANSRLCRCPEDAPKKDIFGDKSRSADGTCRRRGRMRQRKVRPGLTAVRHVEVAADDAGGATAECKRTPGEVGESQDLSGRNRGSEKARRNKKLRAKHKHRLFQRGRSRFQSF